MNNNSITAIVLAAGQGSRMCTSLPKSLHPVAGKPILARILNTLRQSLITDINVVINKEHSHLIKPIAQSFKAQCCIQNEQKGTAAAVLSVPIKEATKSVLIINGDHPLITVEDINNIIKTFKTQNADLCVGSHTVQNPGDYGRIVRQGAHIVAIVEKDSLTHESQKIKEVNAGIYVIKSEILGSYLSQIKNKNPKAEYGLTDIVSLLIKHKKRVCTYSVSEDTALGINTQKALAFTTKKIFIRKLNSLMSEGVIIIDPLTTYIEDTVQIGEGSVIYPGVYLKGHTCIGAFCAIEVNAFIKDSHIHDLVLIRAGSYIELAEVGTNSDIGPYARLRAGTKIKKECRVGNFVELKNTTLGSRSKASHLSYLGDSTIGEDVNIGCSTVTCNLNQDGKKYPTKIGDKVFIGSGTQMVAPVELGDDSATGAGSVITQNVPAKALAIGRAIQKNIENYFLKKNKN